MLDNRTALCYNTICAVKGAPKLNMGEFPSGQRGQTVNLLLSASVVRIHPLPPKKNKFEQPVFYEGAFGFVLLL